MIVDRARLRPNPPARMRAEAQWVDGRHPILVIDDFYADPDYVRSLAIGLDYRAPVAAFPGFEARISIAPDAVLSFLRDRIRGPAEVDRPFRHAFVFRLLSRHAGPELRVQRRPHVDGPAAIAAFVYLNEPGQCSGGTSFFQHRETGLYRWPVGDDPRLRAVMKRHRLRSPSDLMHWFFPDEPPSRAHRLRLIRGSTAQWRLHTRVEMRFNRLVMYSGALFHAIDPGDGDSFGDSPAEGRLTQLVGFHTTAHRGGLG